MLDSYGGSNATEYKKTFVFLYRIFALRGAFLPSPELLNIRKQRRFFKPINTLSTNRLHSISVSSGIKKTTSYWYHQKKDYFCIIKRRFFGSMMKHMYGYELYY